MSAVESDKRFRFLVIVVKSALVSVAEMTSTPAGIDA